MSRTPYLILLALAGAYDVSMSAIGVTNGWSQEANPLAVWSMNNFGTVEGLIGLKSASFAVCLLGRPPILILGAIGWFAAGSLWWFT